MTNGKVLWFDERDGFGIIKGTDGRKYYFDSSVMAQGIKRGDLVSFVENASITDALCAKNVVLS